MILGLYSGAAGAAPAAADSQQWLLSNPRPLQMQFLNMNQSWANGMVSAFFIDTCVGATKAVMSIPMLVGPTAGVPVDPFSSTGETTSPSGPNQGVNPGSPTPTAMTLADVAAGVWDLLFTPTFQTIANVRPDCILRIGWEMYGSSTWWPWSGPGLAAQWVAAYQHLVELARSISGQFEFDWNGAFNIGHYNPITDGGWPGPAFVDYVTADCYQNLSPGSGDVGWGEMVNKLAPGLAFARANEKPFCLPEFGLWPTAEGGSGDDYAWLGSSYFWAQENRDSIGYVNYFNSPGSGISLPLNPQSGALWMNLFAAWAQALDRTGPGRFYTAGTDRWRIIGQ